MPTRACLDCGVLVTGGGSTKQGTRCLKCRRAKQQAKRTKRPHTYAEDKRRAQAVTQWRILYGDLCLGWHRPPHPAFDLTADHVVPVAAGGSEDGALAVLCRACNGAKQASIDSSRN